MIRIYYKKINIQKNPWNNWSYNSWINIFRLQKSETKAINISLPIWFTSCKIWCITWMLPTLTLQALILQNSQTHSINLSATIRRFCLRVFDYVVGLTLKGLLLCYPGYQIFRMYKHFDSGHWSSSIPAIDKAAELLSVMTVFSDG